MPELASTLKRMTLIIMWNGSLLFFYPLLHVQRMVLTMSIEATERKSTLAWLYFKFTKSTLTILGQARERKSFFLLTADSIGTRYMGQGRGLTSDPNRTPACWHTTNTASFFTCPNSNTRFLSLFYLGSKTRPDYSQHDTFNLVLEYSFFIWFIQMEFTDWGPQYVLICRANCCVV